MQNNRAIGSEYEQIAGKYLEQQGYRILCYNYRCPMGEIDMIAMDGDVLVFVEVKYRKNLTKGSPLEAVNVKKQKVISKCANYYITGKKLHGSACRFDVIGIVGRDMEQVEISPIEPAFEYQR